MLKENNNYLKDENNKNKLELFNLMESMNVQKQKLLELESKTNGMGEKKSSNSKNKLYIYYGIFGGVIIIIMFLFGIFLYTKVRKYKARERILMRRFNSGKSDIK